VILFAHRGFWRSEEEQNSIEACSRASRNGFAIEVDVHSIEGKLVVSHDPPKIAGPHVLLRDLLEQFSSNGGSHVAINIKQDGLATLLKAETSDFEDLTCFAFDMSLPELLKYRACSLDFAVRFSEYEERVDSQLVDGAAALWIDSFHDEWWSIEALTEFGNLNHKALITIVSPELHLRDPYRAWEELRKFAHQSDRVALCTDLLEEALDFFR
jgi:hypothetical protein